MRKTRGGWGETGRLSPIFLVATAPFPKSSASYFRFARFNTSALYYLRAWHRLEQTKFGDVTFNIFHYDIAVYDFAIFRFNL